MSEHASPPSVAALISLQETSCKPTLCQTSFTRYPQPKQPSKGHLGGGAVAAAACAGVLTAAAGACGSVGDGARWDGAAGVAGGAEAA